MDLSDSSPLGISLPLRSASHSFIVQWIGQIELLWIINSPEIRSNSPLSMISLSITNQSHCYVHLNAIKRQ